MYMEFSSSVAALATASTAASNAASLRLAGLVLPLILRTNWSEAAWISSSVAAGAKLKSGRMFLHIVSSPFAGAPREAIGLDPEALEEIGQLDGRLRAGQ